MLAYSFRPTHPQVHNGDSLATSGRTKLEDLHSMLSSRKDGKCDDRDKHT